MKLLITLLPVIFTATLMAQKTKTVEKIKFLALGDSYTIGESVAEDERWPAQLVQALRKKNISIGEPDIIATTGWRTDDLKKAILSANLKNDYSLVSLLIGVNNQYQEKTAKSYEPEFEELLNMAIRLADGDPSKVFVVSIPDYGYTPFGKQNQKTISKAIDEYNGINKSISRKYGIRYFYITGISRHGLDNPELVAGDGLHPSGKMYALWVELICKELIR